MLLQVSNFWSRTVVTCECRLKAYQNFEGGKRAKNFENKGVILLMSRLGGGNAEKAPVEGPSMSTGSHSHLLSI